MSALPSMGPKPLFYILEAVAFIAPALLPSLSLRVALCATYYILHASGAQYAYKRFKRAQTCI